MQVSRVVLRDAEYFPASYPIEYLRIAQYLSERRTKTVSLAGCGVWRSSVVQGRFRRWLTAIPFAVSQTYMND